MTRAALLRLGAVLLPLAGLAGLWLTTDRTASQGQVWLAPVEGFDPMDRLQGHYVRYQIVWPGIVDEDGSPRWSYEPVCIEGRPPIITEVIERQPGMACANPVNAQSVEPGRFYASLERAQSIERQLADPKLIGTLRFRLRPDGQIVPLDITFAPRPANRPSRRQAADAAREIEPVAEPGSVESDPPR